MITSKTDDAGQTYYYNNDAFIAITAKSGYYPTLTMVTFVTNSDLTTMVTVYTKPEDVSRFIENITRGKED